jgi:two-component system response regulator YesN
MNNKIYILIISSKEGSSGDIREWSIDRFNNIYKTLSEELWVKTRVGIGDCYKTLKQMTNSFLEARTSVSLEGCTQNVIHIRDIKQGKKSNPYPILKERLLCEKVNMGDEEAIVILDEILDWISWHLSSQEDFKRKIYELVVVLNRAVSSEIKAKNSDSSICFKDIQTMESKGEIKVYVRYLLKRILSNVDIVKLDKAGALIEKIREYIKHNYMQDITLDDMAGMVGLSTFYFSKIFKHYQKINFIDYLTSVRINRAKELLENPLINIKEISNMIGYSEPNYFTRVFRRLEGITPTEYRNKKVLL